MLATCLVCGIDLDDLIGNSRDLAFAEAREIAALVSMKRLDVSFPDIASAMGRRRGGHATMLDRYRRAAKKDAQAERCNDFARLVDMVSDTISESRFCADLAAESRSDDA